MVSDMGKYCKFPVEEIKDQDEPWSQSTSSLKAKKLNIVLITSLYFSNLKAHHWMWMAKNIKPWITLIML